MGKLTHVQEWQEVLVRALIHGTSHNPFECFTLLLERGIPAEGYPRSLVRYLLYFPGACHQRLEILTPNLATVDGRKHRNPDQQSLYQCSERWRIRRDLSPE